MLYPPLPKATARPRPRTPSPGVYGPPRSHSPCPHHPGQSSGALRPSREAPRVCPSRATPPSASIYPAAQQSPLVLLSAGGHAARGPSRAKCPRVTGFVLRPTWDAATTQGLARAPRGTRGGRGGASCAEGSSCPHAGACPMASIPQCPVPAALIFVLIAAWGRPGGCFGGASGAWLGRLWGLLLWGPVRCPHTATDQHSGAKFP